MSGPIEASRIVPRLPRPRAAWIVAFFAIATVASACHEPVPPPRWQEGGAPLTLPQARWETDNETIELTPAGKVLFNGDVVFVIDRVGRVVNDDYEPVALLMPDGSVVGPDDRNFGRVGLRNGAPPGSETAWFSIGPSGAVTFFDTDGERYGAGRWMGCEGAAVRACTLVSHIAFIRASQRRRRSGVGMGVGVWRWR